MRKVWQVNEKWDGRPWNTWYRWCTWYRWYKIQMMELTRRPRGHHVVHQAHWHREIVFQNNVNSTLTFYKTLCIDIKITWWLTDKYKYSPSAVARGVCGLKHWVKYLYSTVSYSSCGTFIHSSKVAYKYKEQSIFNYNNNNNYYYYYYCPTYSILREVQWGDLNCLTNWHRLHCYAGETKCHLQLVAAVPTEYIL